MAALVKVIEKYYTINIYTFFLYIILNLQLPKNRENESTFMLRNFMIITGAKHIAWILRKIKVKKVVGSDYFLKTVCKMITFIYKDMFRLYSPSVPF